LKTKLNKNFKGVNENVLKLAKTNVPN